MSHFSVGFLMLFESVNVNWNLSSGLPDTHEHPIPAFSKAVG